MKKLLKIILFITLFTGILSLPILTASAAEKDSAVTAVVSGQTIDSISVDGCRYLFLPSAADLSEIILKTEAESDKDLWLYNNGYVCVLDGAASVNIENNSVYDTEKSAYAVTLRAVAKDSQVETAEYEEYTVYIMKSSSISALYINVDNPEYGRCWVDSSPNHSNDAAKKADVSMYMENENGDTVYNGKLTSVKGRGNTTWIREKKPYQIKLDKKTDLLESGDSANKNKTWVLLANSFDKVLFKNALAFDLARSLGLEATPEYRMVDLYFDGEYRGVYTLCEKIQINSGRIEIVDLEEYITTEDEAAAAVDKNKYGLEYQYNPTSVCSREDISGGYLLELDNAYYNTENSWFTLKNGNHIVVKSPEFATKEQMVYISELFNEMFTAASSDSYNGKSITEYLDTDSMAGMYLLNEYMKNCDFCASSTYFFLPEKGNEKYENKFYAGPAWDFDTSLGNRTELDWMKDPTTFFRDTNPFFTGSVIRSAIKHKAETLDGLYDVIFSDDISLNADYGVMPLAKYRAMLDDAQKMNYTIWPFDTWGNTFALPDYEQNYNYVYNFLETRHKSILPVIESWETADYSQLEDCKNDKHIDRNNDGICDCCKKEVGEQLNAIQALIKRIREFILYIITAIRNLFK